MRGDHGADPDYIGGIIYPFSLGMRWDLPGKAGHGSGEGYLGYFAQHVAFVTLTKRWIMEGWMDGLMNGWMVVEYCSILIRLRCIKFKNYNNCGILMQDGCRQRHFVRKLCEEVRHAAVVFFKPPNKAYV